jgi:hypothetical protein
MMMKFKRKRKKIYIKGKENIIMMIRFTRKKIHIKGKGNK